MSKKLILYTRKPGDEYSVRVACSLHLALEDNGKVTVLNHNSGVLFATASENPDGSLNAKCLRNPVACTIPGGYRITFIRTDENGNEDTESPEIAFTCDTKDFARYSIPVPIRKDSSEFLRLISSKNLDSDLCTEKGAFNVFAKALSSDAVISDCIEISDETALFLSKKLLTPVNVSNTVCDCVTVSSADELNNVKAKAGYSDGSFCEKKVDWDISGIDFTKPGEYRVSGKIHQDHFEFPVFENRADPCIGRWNGKYYFIATTDEDGNRSIYIRRSDSVANIKDSEPVLLFNTESYEGIGGLLWAPEFHEINGRLCIFHAAALEGKFFWEESRVMILHDGGNPMNPSDWDAPRKVVRADGSDICEEGKEITLDMTCFPIDGEYYVVWSQRQFIPKDLGAWLYIAKLNSETPWKLASEPVVLAKPEFSFENNHTFVVEGPFALMGKDRIFLTYSGAAVDDTYIVNMLSIENGKDLLCRANWTKTNYPLLTARSTPGEYGTGHNAYVIDDDGTVWNTYHARPGMKGPRSTGIRRVHFGFDNEPVLDMHEHEDLNPALADVSLLVRIC